VAYLGLEKTCEKRESFGQPAAYIAEGERERGVAVPHVNDRTPASSQTGGTINAPDFPYSGVAEGWASIGF
jgi:hypothetical protein